MRRLKCPMMRQLEVFSMVYRFIFTIVVLYSCSAEKKLSENEEYFFTEDSKGFITLFTESKNFEYGSNMLTIDVLCSGKYSESVDTLELYSERKSFSAIKFCDSIEFALRHSDTIWYKNQRFLKAKNFKTFHK